MANNLNFDTKPSIKIFFDESSIKELDFKEVVLGIEEEGIPYEIYKVVGSDAISLGYEASIQSNLGVGLGVSSKNIVLHYNKLEKDSPLYIIDTKYDKKKMRALGCNAARLVVKMPFKKI